MCTNNRMKLTRKILNMRKPSQRKTRRSQTRQLKKPKMMRRRSRKQKAKYRLKKTHIIIRWMY